MDFKKHCFFSTEKKKTSHKMNVTTTKLKMPGWGHVLASILLKLH